MVSHIKTASKTVLSKPGYAMLAIGVGLVLYVGVGLLPNYQLIGETLASAQPLSSKVSLFVTLVQATFNVPWSMLLMQGVLMLLVGMSSSLIVYKALADQGMIGFQSILSTLFAVSSSGCATCGLGILPMLGLGGVLATLPFRGQEFWLVGMLLVLYTIHKTAQSITSCKITSCKITARARHHQ